VVFGVEGVVVVRSEYLRLVEGCLGRVLGSGFEELSIVVEEGGQTGYREAAGRDMRVVVAHGETLKIGVEQVEVDIDAGFAVAVDGFGCCRDSGHLLCLGSILLPPWISQ